ARRLPGRPAPPRPGRPPDRRRPRRPPPEPQPRPPRPASPRGCAPRGRRPRGRRGTSRARARGGSGSRSGAVSSPPRPRTGSPASPWGDTSPVDNAEIARTLDAYAALLDLAGAAHWSVRAYRRAADLIRATPAPGEELVRTRRARELRGIGPGIERRLRELVETGRIAELEELEREVEPELVALGRYLGLGPQPLPSVSPVTRGARV